MRADQTPTKPSPKAWVAMALNLGLLMGLSGPVQAESLFRAGISYQTSQSYTPRSLYSIPRPASVGDMVTININEVTQLNLVNNNLLNRRQSIDENNTSTMNRILRHITGTKGNLFPSVDGVNNQTRGDLQARSQKVYQLRDAISCQVVQVLPNGNLVVQGRKTVFANGEQQDLYVSGIVNPFFINNQNTIASSQVANLQMQLAGKGNITRHHGDGLFGKYLQFFN